MITFFKGHKKVHDLAMTRPTIDVSAAVWYTNINE